jgi:hypothetical protein
MSGALVGVPGSGRSTFLLKLTFDLARQWSESQPLAVYLNAADFLPYARNRRTIHELIARQVLKAGFQVDIEAMRRGLQAYDEAGQLLLLVDDLDRLSSTDQSEVLGQLAFSPAVLYTTVPWQANRVLSEMHQAHVGAFKLLDLDVQQQRELLWRAALDRKYQEVDLDLGYVALTEVPDLSTLPLGVMAVYEQVQVYRGTRTQIVQCALQEWLERAGFGRPACAGEWLDLEPVARSLRQLAAVWLSDLLWYGESSDEEVWVTRARYEHTLTPEWHCHWDLLVQSRLVETHPSVEAAVRFYNRDVLSYLAVLGGFYGFNWSKATGSPGVAHLHRQTIGFAETLWEEDAVAASQKIFAANDDRV